MADVKISGLPASSTPLAGTEVLPIVQGGVTDQVSVANLTAGRAVSALSLTTTADSTINGLTVGKGGGSVNYNTAVGYQTGFTNSSGAFDAFGSQVLYANTTGQGNVGFGGGNSTGVYSALRFNTTGNCNSAYGVGALSSNTTNSNSTAVGYNAGYLSTGVGNQLFGYIAGSGITTGDHNVILGCYQGAAAPISATGSGYIVLSDAFANVRAYFNGANATFNGTISPVQAATVSAPTYVKGAIYFDTTLNKLRVGGAAGWETITSV